MFERSEFAVFSLLRRSESDCFQIIEAHGVFSVLAVFGGVEDETKKGPFGPLYVYIDLL